MNQILKRSFGFISCWYITFSHYVEDVHKQPLSSEELKWIDYIHREVVPSVSLYNSSSLGNIKYACFSVLSLDAYIVLCMTLFAL